MSIMYVTLLVFVVVVHSIASCPSLDRFSGCSCRCIQVWDIQVFDGLWILCRCLILLDYVLKNQVIYLGIEFYLFVSHGGMNDRGSTCKFRNARSAFRNLHVDPLSFIPP